jgi:hypothetical protein
MSERPPGYICPHVWMVLPSMNIRLCYACGMKQPLSANHPMLPLPGVKK